METTKRELLKHKNRLFETFQREGRHLRLHANSGKLVVVGDLHGDGRTLDLILTKFLFKSDNYSLIFLGDYVDREPDSWVNRESAVIDRLLSLKLQYPERIYLLLGNHDLNPVKFTSFYSTFWDNLDPRVSSFYTDVLSTIPFIASTHNGVALCHGTLPSKTDFEFFDLSSKYWLDCIWADYYDKGEDISLALRPVRRKKDFTTSMNAFKCSVLIKGHNPSAKLLMYDNRCLTIQSNRFYKDYCGMHVAIVDLAKPAIEVADDLEILNLNSLL